MLTLPAHDGITLALGGNTVRLRPTLRAASQLAAPPELGRCLAEFDLGTIRDIIMTAATDRQDAKAFLAAIDATPLQAVTDAVTAPLFLFLGSFSPASTDDEAKPTPAGKPIAWPDAVKMLFRRATGWLGWTPEVAWNATPTEISEAFAGWLGMQTALHGSPDAETKPSDAYSPEHLRQIEEQGFDPAFDREGLRALKAKIASGR